MSDVPLTMRGRSELGVAALLGALGVIVAVDAAGIRHTAVSSGVMGPAVVPYLIALGLGLCAVALAVNVLRGGHGHPEEGEDIDLTTGAHWPTLLGLGGLILAAALVMEVLGFVVTTALLFYGATLLLGSRHYVGGLLIGIVLAVGTFYGFVLGLGIPLPAGLLTGIL